jgi:hypothetical protein
VGKVFINHIIKISSDDMNTDKINFWNLEILKDKCLPRVNEITGKKFRPA